MRRSSTLVLGTAAAVALGLTVGNPAQAALLVSNNNNATSLANAIVGTGVTIVGTPTLFSHSAAQQGTFTATPDIFANAAMSSGVMLTTGDINWAPGPNIDDGSALITSWNPNQENAQVPPVQRNLNPSLDHFDVNRLSFNFTVPANTGGITVQYVFASEEYPEFVFEDFNDSFAFVVDGVNAALVPNSNSPVTIDSINQFVNSAYYRDNDTNPNAINIEYDGLTHVLTANVFAALNPNLSTHSMIFSIADVGDSFWDSAVFIRADSFQVPEPTTLGVLACLGAMALRRKR